MSLRKSINSEYTAGGQKVKYSELMDFLNDIETKFPVDQWSVEEINIWPLLRIQLMFYLDGFNPYRQEDKRLIPQTINGAKRLLQLWRGFTKYLYAFLADYQHNDLPNHKADAIFLSHTTSRFFSVSGEKYDAFIEPMRKLLSERGMSCFSLEYAPKDEYRIPRFGKSMFIQPYLTFLRLINVLCPCKNRVLKNESSLNDFISFIQSHQHNIDLLNLASIQRQARLIRWMANYFKRIFQRIRPTMGFVVSYYSIEGMAFNLACREFLIPSIDIQHCVQNQFHPAYGRWHKIPQKGYALLPKLFWCWSQNEEKSISEWSSKVPSEHQAIAGGNLLLEMFKNEHNDMVKDFDRQILDMIKKNQSSINILVTLQTGHGLPELIRQAIASSPDSWFWWLRLHPGMMIERNNVTRKLKKLSRKNWNLVQASNLPLYTIL